MNAASLGALLRRHRTMVAVPVLVALCLGTTSLFQTRIDRHRADTFDDELLYLPNEKLLNHFTGGMSSVIADILWLQCIQYTSKHFKGDHKFTWLGHMTDTITRLDPYFVDVYRYGGIFLASLKADDDASLRLLERGFCHNPEAWELPYEAAMVYLLNRREQPGSAELAARYLALSVGTERAPHSVLEIVQGLQRKHNLVDIERQLWTNMLKTSKDEFRRDLAERKLKELTIRQNVTALAEVVEYVKRTSGQTPTDLAELVKAGMIDRIPEDPLGGRYFIDAEGEVVNTTLLDASVERRINVLRDQIKYFRTQQGRNPASLEEMVKLKFVPALPSHPYKDRTWQYDPATGEVQ